MQVSTKLSSFLFVASSLYTTTTFNSLPAQSAEDGLGASQSRCVADLSRVDTAFCIADRNAKKGEAAPQQALSYKWTLDDNGFDLTSRVCLSAGGASGSRQDLVVAIDRSRSVWSRDAVGSKEGSFNIASTRLLIETLRREAQSAPDAAPDFGLMMFSSDDTCAEYVGGSIRVNRTFPCLYVPAKSIADSAHVARLLEMLRSAEGKYSQGGLSEGADYTIVSKSLTDNVFGLGDFARAGLILMSDGRTYKGVDGDMWAYMRGESYRNAQASAAGAFSASAMRRYRMIFALNPTERLAFGNVHIDAYENMCALAGASPADCRSPVVLRTPSTWPINRIDTRAVATDLVSKTGGSADQVVLLSTREAILPALEKLRHSGESVLAVESAALSLDGVTFKPGVVSGDRVRFNDVPGESKLNASLKLTVEGREVMVPIGMELSTIAASGATHTDREMVCSALPAAPRPSLKDLQGGSASCGVVAGSMANTSGSAATQAGIWILTFIPLLFGGFFLMRGRRDTAIVLLAATGLAGVATTARADGVNALQYRPVIDGVGVSERAQTSGKGSWSAGVFYDYANDAIELGGDKNKRESSVVDDLTTAHVAAGFGVLKNMSLGLSMPVVMRNDLDRTVGGDSSEGSAGLSDVTIHAKFHVARAAEYDLGVMPVVIIPTGNPDTLTGDGSASYGLLGLVSKNEGRFSWAGNFGYMQRQKALSVEDDRAEKLVVRGQWILINGVAWQYRPSLAFSGSLQIKMSAGEGLDLAQSSPAEWSAGARWRAMPNLDLSSSIGTGVGKGYGSPDYRFVVGASWSVAGGVSSVRRPLASAPQMTQKAHRAGRRQ